MVGVFKKQCVEPTVFGVDDIGRSDIKLLCSIPRTERALIYAGFYLGGPGAINSDAAHFSVGGCH